MGQLLNISKRAATLIGIVVACTLAPDVHAADTWKLKDTSGARYQLSALKGKWVLVNFWAPWCPVCISEMPDLNTLQKQHPDLQIIGVAVMYKNKREVANIMQTHPMAYPVVMGDEDIASDFGEIRGMPTSFLYAPDGKRVGRHDGPLTSAEVESVMQQKPGANLLFTP